MRMPFVILSIAFFVMTFITYLVGGWNQVTEGFQVTLETIPPTIPLIVAAFFVIGQLRVTIKEDAFKKWIEKYDGFKAVLATALLGGLFPGPPYTYYPFLHELKEKDLPVYLYYTFLAGKHTYDLTRLPMEISLISPPIALLRNVITLPIPLLMAFVYKMFFKDMTTLDFFKKFTHPDRRDRS